MKIIKKLLFVVLIVVVLGTGFYWANNQGYLKNTPLANISLPSSLQNVAILKNSSSSLNSFIEQEKIQEIAKDATNQTQILTEKVGEVGGHAQKVLGNSIQSANDKDNDGSEASENGNKPLHERTLEYGKYLYCKQVVAEYEK